MRRARVAGLAIAAAAAAGVARPAAAEPPAVTVEAGAEADTNVRRVETAAASSTPRIAAGVARLGAKLQHDRALAGGRYAITASGLSRAVLGARGRDRGEVTSEDVALVAADVRWMRAVGTRPVAIGAAVLGVGALPLRGRGEARRYGTAGADVLLALRRGEDRALTLALGGRAFAYEPDDDAAMEQNEAAYDWRGPTGTLRLDLRVWQDARGSRTLEVSGSFGFEARAYSLAAFASGCPEDEPPARECYAPSSFARSDRFQRAALEVTWSGRVVAAAAYQLAVTDSNSYGQSLVRHRARLSAAIDLPWRLYGTALATLQLDTYPDGLPLDLTQFTQTFTTLDDENRSSLQVRLARPLSDAWSIEGRAAIWRNLGGNLDAEFRRGLVYVGAVYSR